MAVLKKTTVNGKITQNSSGDYSIDSTISNTWTGHLHSMAFTAPNMADGNHLTFAQGGYSKSTLNHGYISFYKAGSGSTSNYVSVGLLGVDDVLKVRGDRAVLADTFVGNLTGTANKATADKNGLEIDTGYLKNSDIPNKIPLRRYGNVVDNNATAGTTWGCVAQIAIPPSIYVDKNITLLVESGYGGIEKKKVIGILYLGVRNEYSATTCSVNRFIWLIKNDNTNYPLSNFVAISNGLNAYLFVKTILQHSGISFSVLSEKDTAGADTFSNFTMNSILNPTITDLSTVTGTQTASTMETLENNINGNTNGTAARATGDINGLQINTNYLRLSGGSLTGAVSSSSTISSASTISASSFKQIESTKAYVDFITGSGYDFGISGSDGVVYGLNTGTNVHAYYDDSGYRIATTYGRLSSTNTWSGNNTFSNSSSTFAGTAAKASALSNTVSIGSSTEPVYFGSGGTPQPSTNVVSWNSSYYAYGSSAGSVNFHQSAVNANNLTLCYAQATISAQSSTWGISWNKRLPVTPKIVAGIYTSTTTVQHIFTPIVRSASPTGCTVYTNGYTSADSSGTLVVIGIYVA